MTTYFIMARQHSRDLSDLETVSAGNLHGAKTRVAELRAKYPLAGLIHVRQLRKDGRSVTLHDLTVQDGKTAAERRAIACAEAIAAHELRKAARL